MNPFRKLQEFVQNIPVVNDAAERNVKLIQDLISGSQDEELQQDLLLAVEKKRNGCSIKGEKKQAFVVWIICPKTRK